MNAILLLGTTLLVFGTAGMVTVRLSNPRLHGLGWMAGAFAAGGVGAALLLMEPHFASHLPGAGSDLAVLLAFVLLQCAVLELLEERHRVPGFGLWLLGLEVLAQLWMCLSSAPGRMHIVVIGFMMAAQGVQTAMQLVRQQRPGMRASMLFNAGILVCYAVLNVLRSLIVVVELRRTYLFGPIEVATYVGYVAAALGLAFGFFWMTTAKLSAELEHMANTDPLTRVYNRRVFRDWCAKEWARSQRDGSTFSLLVVDVDHFKRVNDRYGHRAGDLVLCAIVEQMQDSVRGIDVLGRWGGEEFVSLLPGADRDAALLVAQRIRRNVEALRLTKILPAAYEFDVEEDGLTVSIGMASFRGGADRVEEMMDRADAALYRAKAEGRNRVLTAQ